MTIALFFVSKDKYLMAELLQPLPDEGFPHFRDCFAKARLPLLSRLTGRMGV